MIDRAEFRNRVIEEYEQHYYVGQLWETLSLEFEDFPENPDGDHWCWEMLHSVQFPTPV